MKLALLIIVATSFAARAEDAPKSDEKPKVEKVIGAALPPVAMDHPYRAPGDLPPVTAQLFHLGGMTEIQPMMSVSVGDPFWRTLAAGLRLEHHLDERWSLAVHALGGFGLVDAPIDMCGSDACSSPENGQLRSAPGKLTFLTGAEIGWAPIYGKLNIFGDKTIHFDAYFSLGPELVRELIAPDTASPVSGRWAPGGRASIGERVFLSNNFMIRVAASELVYSGSVRGNGEIERKLSFEGGVAWLFGVGH